MHLTFEPEAGRIRRARFARRPSVPVDAACALASGLRDALQGVLGAACSVAIGEPVALDAGAWRSLSAAAMAFAVPGRDTDAVVVLARRDARALIAAAFGEEPAPHDAPWTPLEAGAVKRIIGRAAAAFDRICGERRGPVRAVDPARVGPCVEYVDLRVSAPVRLTIGIGLLRPLAIPPPARTLSPHLLDAVPLDVRAVLGRGVLLASRVLSLRVGEIVPLATKVAGEGELNVAGHGIALGSCGVLNGHVAFDVQATSMRGDAP